MGEKSYDNVANNTAASWWNDAGLRKNVLHILILYLGVYSLGYDGSLLAGLQALKTWNAFFGSPTGTRLGLIAASYYLPKIPLGPVNAWISDRFGRKIVAFLGAAFMIAGAIVGAFSQNVAQLIASRILLGVGTSQAHLAASALVPELSHPRLRHFAGSYLLTTFYIGSIFASWLCFAMVYFNPATSDWSWRIPTLVQGFGPALLLAGIYFVPESPRWLITKGRHEQAHAILAKYHANGDMDDELVHLEIREINASLEVERAAKQSKWSTWVTTRGGLKRGGIIVLIGVATQWAGNGVVQYYLVPVLRQVGITQQSQTTGINGGLSIFAWFASLFGAGLVERFGRRPLFLTSIVAMLTCFIMIMGLSAGYASNKNPNVGIAVIPFIYLFQASYAVALTPLPLLYVPEITPLTMRAKGIAILIVSQNTCQAFNQFVNPIALAAIAWKYYAVYVALLGFYFVVFFLFIKETRGLTTEEAALVYSDPRDKAMIEHEGAGTTAADDDSKDGNERIEKV